MKLILTRHGETEENKAEIVQGHLPGKLSADGIKQSKKVALRLKGEKIDYIYSSDLDRAVDTAKIIAVYHKQTPIKFKKETRERYLGSYQGKRTSDIIGPTWPEDGESFDELYNRAKRFFDGLLLKHSNDTLLLVGHNQFNKALVAVITGKKPEDIEGMEKPHNTNITTFEIDAKKNYKIPLFNCKKHLD
ncbi:MAG TPA: histidine phosphatase family protein [Candidatus Absconditabacterales bacterium]|nr:histidine phosphatase family protein [Candidatus Absconditabacterales bacterium]